MLVVTGFAALWAPTVRDAWNRRLARRELPIWAAEHGFEHTPGDDLGTWSGTLDGYRVVIAADELVRVHVLLKHPPGFSVSRVSTLWTSWALWLMREDPGYDRQFDFGDPVLDAYFQNRSRQYESDTIERIGPQAIAALRPFVDRWGPQMRMLAVVHGIELAPTLGAQKGLHAIRPWVLDQLLPDAVAVARALDTATEQTAEADRIRRAEFEAQDLY